MKVKQPTDLLTELRSIREKMSTTQEEMKRISSAPRAHTEVIAEFTDALNRLAADGEAELQAAATTFAAAGFEVSASALEDSLLASMITMAGADAVSYRGISPRILVFVAREQIRATISDQLAKLDGGAALSREERTAKLAQLTEQLDKFEQQEERTIRELEGQGIQEDRRAAARPDLVLDYDAAAGTWNEERLFALLGQRQERGALYRASEERWRDLRDDLQLLRGRLERIQKNYGEPAPSEVREFERLNRELTVAEKAKAEAASRLQRAMALTSALETAVEKWGPPRPFKEVAPALRQEPNKFQSPVIGTVRSKFIGDLTRR